MGYECTHMHGYLWEPHMGWDVCRRSNRGGTRQCHAEVISTRDLQRAVDFVSGVVPWHDEADCSEWLLNHEEWYRCIRRYMSNDICMNSHEVN